jgi:hypothetical protein
MRHDSELNTDRCSRIPKLLANRSGGLSREGEYERTTVLGMSRLEEGQRLERLSEGNGPVTRFADPSTRHGPTL